MDETGVLHPFPSIPPSQCRDVDHPWTTDGPFCQRVHNLVMIKMKWTKENKVKNKELSGFNK